MHAQLRDLTQGPLAKQILLFSLPLIASNLLQVLFNMSDVAVVGRFAGSVALGAVGSTTTLVTLFTGFIIGMSNGVNVLTALHFGAKSRRELSDTIHSAILICLVRLVQRIVRAMHRKQAGFAAWVLHVGTAAVWIYAGVCALWGTQYYAPSFAAQANMQAPALSVEQLAATTVWFAEQVNAAADTVPRDETGLFAVSKEKILLNTGHVYDGIVAEYPFLAGPHRSPKPAFYSKLMSAAGFTGYLCPLFGESTLNVDCPAVFLPATIAHEFSHQRGVAAEQEANFVAIRASTTCGDAAYEYSGWLMGYLYLSNAWYSADQQAASENYRTLCDAARTDLADNNAYWAKWEGPVKEAGSTVYTGFLRGYDQTLGMKSYGACVDLLVEYYYPMAQGE